MSSNKELTLQVFRIGFACARNTENPIPSTSDEMYDILQEVGIGIERGDTVAQVREKLDRFLNTQKYDRAMRIV